MRFLVQKRDVQNKLSKGCHVAEVTIEGPSIAAPSIAALPTGRIPTLGGAAPIPDLKNL